MSEPVTLILPILLLSKNTRDKLHRNARRTTRSQYLRIVGLKYPRKVPTPNYRQIVTMTRVLGKHERLFDEQNIGAGSAIELIDCMTELGWWKDDSPKWLSTRFEQTRSGQVKGPATLVRIEIAAEAERSAIQVSIRKLSTFRTQCLLGEGPASITVDGFTFRDELEAEGYLAELGAALEELGDG